MDRTASLDAPNSVEQAVIEAWSEVLGVPAPQAGDDFFARGGHSLLALRMLFLLRRRLGVDIPLAELLDAADLAAFCARVQAAANAAGPPGTNSRMAM